MNCNDRRLRPLRIKHQEAGAHKHNWGMQCRHFKRNLFGGQVEARSSWYDIYIYIRIQTAQRERDQIKKDRHNANSQLNYIDRNCAIYASAVKNEKWSEEKDQPIKTHEPLRNTRKSYTRYCAQHKEVMVQGNQFFSWECIEGRGWRLASPNLALSKASRISRVSWSWWRLKTAHLQYFDTQWQSWQSMRRWTDITEDTL